MYPRLNESLHREPSRFDNSSRRFERIDLPISAELTYPGRGIRDIHSANVVLQNIGPDGAAIRSGSLQTIPDLFYMEPKGSRSSVACQVVGRRNDTIHVKFHRELTRAELDTLVETHFRSRH